MVNKGSSLHRRFLVKEMGFRVCVRKTFLDKLRNAIIRDVEVKKTVKDQIDEKLLIGYGHVHRIEEHCLPRQALEWSPIGASI
jgi:hypothetical protein